MLTYENYQQSAHYLRQQIGQFQPEILLTLGSGLGFLADQAEDPMAKSPISRPPPRRTMRAASSLAGWRAAG